MVGIVRHRVKIPRVVAYATLLFAALLPLSACGGTSEGATGTSFSVPEHITQATFNQSSAQTGNDAAIDTSSVSEGYVGAAATNSQKLKFLVTSGDATYSYDLPGDGTPIICSLTFGNGTYQFRVMQNTSGDNYIELLSTTAEVTLNSEFVPYVIPNTICDFSEDSACVTKARELTSSATNEGEALENVCQWIVDNISYDNEKASQLKQSTGYVPNPDSTLEEGKGICFDYASLGAAMLRSLGIPTKIVCGYVSPDQIYHAWIMVYIDGTWTSAQFDVQSKTWSRVDLTFAASGDSENVGDGKEYTDRYVY